jgi:hypothetical protein
MCQRPEKSRENAPELIGFIFQGLRLSTIAWSNIDLLTSLLTFKKILAFYLLQKIVSHNMRGVKFFLKLLRDRRSRCRIMDRSFSREAF